MDLWDFFQERRIGEASSRALKGQHTAENALDTVQELEHRVNRLSLINMALWSLLKERAGLKDEDLTKRMEEIDLSDGHLDGRVRATLRTCPNCGRTLSQRHGRCLYCGDVAAADEPFRGV